MRNSRSLGRFALAASMALSVVACSKAPNQATPVTPPASSVTVPVTPSLGNNVTKSGVDLAVPAPVAAPVVAAPAVGLPVGLALGATPVPLIPFTSFINGAYKLFVYDRTIADNYALPGAGDGIHNPTIFSGNRILFDRSQDHKRQIYFYDVVGELNGTFNDVNGLGDVRRPSITFDGTVMTFIHNGLAFIWINGIVADLAKINSLAALNDSDVNFMRVSCDGKWIVFTTTDGNLYVYDVVNPMVHQITAAVDVGDGFATHPAISPDGTQIAWADSSGKIFRYDRVTNLVDPMPFLNTAFNNEFITDPLWECWDNAHIYAELGTFGPPVVAEDRDAILSTVGTACERKGTNENFRYIDSDFFSDTFLNTLRGGSGVAIERNGDDVVVPAYVTRIVEYNWITETLAGLTVLNSVLGEGDQLISDPGRLPVH